MKVRNHLARFFLVLLPAPSILGDDWPTYQHDNQRTGVTAEELRPPLHLLWEFNSPFPPAKGWALPVNGYGARKNKPNVSYDDAFRVIAVGDSAYFSSSCENKVYAVDASTGELKWTFFTDAAPRLAPAYWKDRLYFGADDGCLYCVNAGDGSLDWKVSIAPNRERMLGKGRFGSKWPLRSGGIVEDGIVYVTSGLFPSEGIYLCAINAENGSFIWKHRLDNGGIGQSPSPQGYVLATDDSIYLTSRVVPTRWRKKDGKNIGFTTPYPEVRRAHEYRFLTGGSYAQIWNGRNLVFGKACILGYDPDQEYKDRYGRTLKGALLFNWFNARQAAFKSDVAFLATDFYTAAVRQDRLGELSKNECRVFEDDVYKAFRAAHYMELLEKHKTLSQALGEEHAKARSIKNGPLKWGLPFWKKWLAARDPAIQKIASKCEWLVPVV
ncbi:MAG: PQQ-binding-like beta-propeller repeat protein, partial [Planctomycetota bacterium]|nr:PQQ-binding-like beta-propeller repeat protein [Planctomycetota bacterium]